MVALDLGSSVTTVAIGERHDYGNLHILGLGQAPSAGVEHGQISHVARAAEAIRQALDQAEASAGREILSVGLAIAGAHLQSMNNRGAVAMPSSGDPIRDADLIRAIDSGRVVTINPADTLLHAIPRYYVVDSERRSFDPRGQHAQRLDVSMHLVTASLSAIQNAAHCLQIAGVDIELIAAKPVVAGERAVRGNEKEYGALVVGLGAGTTTLTAYEDGAISHTSCLPVGGGHITRDLSVGLHCTAEEAEVIKRAHGYAIPQLVPHDAAQIDLRGFSPASDSVGSVTPFYVSEIIQARLIEVISMIRNQVTEHQLQQALAGGIVLTGGGAILPDVDVLFSKALNTPARIAQVGDLYGLTDKLRHPDALSVVGMLDWMLESSNTVESNSGGGWRSRASGGGSVFSSLASGVSNFARAFSTSQ